MIGDQDLEHPRGNEYKFVIIEFKNIKKLAICFEKSRSGTKKAKLLIQLTDPCQCKEEGNSVPSFFSLDELHPYLSFWNLNQTFLLEGTTTVEAMHNLIDLVRFKNEDAKIYDGNCVICRCEPLISS